MSFRVRRAPRANVFENRRGFLYTGAIRFHDPSIGGRRLITIRKQVYFMELRQLQYFLIVTQELSFSKAAKKAYVSQQAISKAIQSLEDDLGVSLFTRLPHGVELTNYGQMLLKKAYSISNSVNEISFEMHAAKNNIQSLIPLAITAGAVSWLDVKKLLAFHDAYPDYHISTFVSADKDIEHDMIAEKIELGIMGSRGTTSKLEFTSLMEASTYLAVNRKNPLSEMNSVSLEDLKDQNFIIGSDDFYGCNQVKTLCNANGFSLNVLHQTHDISYVMKLLSFNEGVFLCPEPTLKLFGDKDIRLIPIRNDPKIYSIQLTCKKNATLSKGAALLKDYLLKKLKQ